MNSIVHQRWPGTHGTKALGSAELLWHQGWGRVWAVNRRHEAIASHLVHFSLLEPSGKISEYYESELRKLQEKTEHLSGAVETLLRSWFSGGFGELRWELRLSDGTCRSSPGPANDARSETGASACEMTAENKILKGGNTDRWTRKQNEHIGFPFDLALEVVTSANDDLQQLLQILLYSILIVVSWLSTSLVSGIQPMPMATVSRVKVRSSAGYCARVPAQFVAWRRLFFGEVGWRREQQGFRWTPILERNYEMNPNALRELMWPLKSWIDHWRDTNGDLEKCSGKRNRRIFFPFAQASW
jgi:hypothetical protein